MKRVGTAIVGCGKVGETHARALAAMEESRFVGVYSRRPEPTQAFAARHGVRAYRSLDELLANPEVQMISVCSPHATHPDLVEAAAGAGTHVLVEKPMAVDLQGCERSIKAAERAGVKLGVISQRRFYEPVRRV